MIAQYYHPSVGGSIYESYFHSKRNSKHLTELLNCCSTRVKLQEVIDLSGTIEKLRYVNSFQIPTEFHFENFVRLWLALLNFKVR